MLALLALSVMVRDDLAVPFRYVRPDIPLLIVSAKVEGKGPYDFILDTGNGAFPLLLRPGLAKELKVTPKPKSTKTGFIVGLKSTLEAAEVKAFEFGPIKTGALTVGISPALDELSERLKTRIDGNIGYEFLKDYTVTLDYQNSTLSLGREGITGDTMGFDVGDKNPLILLKAEINGQPVHLVLDTGASFNCVSMETAKKLDLPHGPDVPLNLSKDEKGFQTTLRSLKVDGQEQVFVGAIAASFVDRLASVLEKPVDGVLGYNFCRQFKITIDYPRRRLRLEKF